MNDYGNTIYSVEELMSEVDKNYACENGKLSKNIEDEISVRPDWAIALIKYLQCIDESTDRRQMNILCRLIDESLSQIRYRIDRKDTQGHVLLEKVQKELITILPALPSLIRFAVNKIMFDSKLPFDINEHPNQPLPREDANTVDITPQLPELLEQLRRENTFKTCFELYELILPQIQLVPIITQLSMIAEMASSKKPIAHELAVLMLLHPKPEIRKRVSGLLYTFSDKQVFTPIDLRRLIVIRNWVPIDERQGIDKIISYLRKNKLSPAPYPPCTPSKLVGSCMDGAGVLSIMMEYKQNKKRRIAGFILKIGVGVRDQWVMNKAPKGYFEQISKEHARGGLPTKPVSKAYVSKVVRHFLSESIANEIVPEASFVEVAELFGANNWHPQPLSFTDEVNRLKDIYKDDLTQEQVNSSLQRSGKWYFNADIADSWFEVGEAAEASLIEAREIHEKDESQSVEAIVTVCLMNHCLEKWKTIFLVSCLWMRSKEEDELCYDLFVIIHSINNAVPLSSIPLVCNIGAKSTATVLRRELY